MRSIPTPLPTLALILALTGAAQAAEPPRLAEDGGGYGGPVLKLEDIEGEGALLIGGEGAGWIGQGRHAFSLGGGGYGTTRSIDLDNDRRLSFGYGGFTLGYRYRPADRLHLDSRLLLGGGSAGLTDAQGLDVAGDDFLVGELTLGGQVRLTRYFSLGLGVYQRLTSELRPDELADDSLNNRGLALTVRLGRQ